MLVVVDDLSLRYECFHTACDFRTSFAYKCLSSYYIPVMFKIIIDSLIVLLFMTVGTSCIMDYTREVLPKFIKLFLDLLFKLLV